MAIPRVVAWKLRKTNKNLFGKSHDMQNVFGLTDHDMIEETCLEAKDVPLLNQRQEAVLAQVHACDDTIPFQAFSGGLQGCSTKPAAFMTAFYSLVSGWLDEQFEEEIKLFVCRTEIIPGGAFNSLVTAFVDDLLRVLMVQG